MCACEQQHGCRRHKITENGTVGGHVTCLLFSQFPDVDFGAVAEQHFDHRSVALGRGDVQRREPIGRRRIHLGARSHQQTRALERVKMRGKVKRGRPVRSARRHAGTARNQVRDDAPVSLLHRQLQREHAPVGRASVHIPTGVYQSAQRLELSLSGGVRDGRHAVVVPHGHLRAAVEEKGENARVPNSKMERSQPTRPRVVDIGAGIQKHSAEVLSPRAHGRDEPLSEGVLYNPIRLRAQPRGIHVAPLLRNAQRHVRNVRLLRGGGRSGRWVSARHGADKERQGVASGRVTYSPLLRVSGNLEAIEREHKPLCCGPPTRARAHTCAPRTVTFLRLLCSLCSLAQTHAHTPMYSALI
eukprot:Opistho-1_new@38865